MIENPELRAKILEWQKRHNIQDGDPAIALLELVQFLDQRPASVISAPAADGREVTAAVSPESLSEAMKTALLPVTERLSFQTQELQQRLDHMDFEKFVKQIEGFHEGIDYCTKRLDVVRKEADALVVKLEKAGSRINPVTRGAVITLMIGAAIAGAILSRWLW